jgi:hypothetical protein
VTRWRRHSDYQTVKYVRVEGRHLLEFLACRDPLYGEWKLPGGKILGNSSQYQIVCACFSELVFEKTNIDHRYIETERHMKKFFSNFAADTARPAQDGKRRDMNNSFTAKMIYKGYIDDPRNTDNAWVEAEIWNMHYDGQDKLNDYIPDVSPTLNQTLNSENDKSWQNQRHRPNGKRWHRTSNCLPTKAPFSKRSRPYTTHSTRLLKPFMAGSLVVPVDISPSNRIGLEYS